VGEDAVGRWDLNLDRVLVLRSVLGVIRFRGPGMSVVRVEMRAGGH
jgi:hypothetical protein